MQEPGGFAEVRLDRQGINGRPVVELTVPRGTRLVDMVNVHKTLAEEILPKISPVGCLPCHSGCDINLREQLEDVIRIDFGGKLLQGRIPG